MRKGWAVVMAAVLLCCSWARADAAPGVEGKGIEVAAKAAILIERESGRVLFEHNADVRYPMASTTKIMTALIAVEHCEMDEIVTAGKNASGVTGTSIYLSVGEQLTMEHMLQGLMLRSGNDAAVAIAEHIAGSVEHFAFLMNERARMLEADARFVTPNGLDAPGHGASARAMALITREAMGNEAFRRLVSMQRAVIPWVGSEYSRVLQNKNRLLSEYEGATGVKTGFTSKAGRCLVFSAEREGMELIGVVMNCPGWFDEAKRMLDWGFGNFSVQQLVEAGERLGEAEIVNGMNATVGLCAQEALCYPLGPEDQWRVEHVGAERLEAPVEKGDPAGWLVLTVNGEEAARIGVVVQERVERRSLVNRMRKWMRSLRFWK